MYFAKYNHHCYFINIHPNGYTTSNAHRIHVDITSIRRRPNFDKFPRHFRVLFRCNFDDWKIHVVSTYFFRGNFAGRKIQVISAYFFDAISMVGKSTLFPPNFIGVISLVENSTLFPSTFFDVIAMAEIYTLFLLTFFGIILMGKNSTSFLVSCKLMKTFEKVFPVFVTLNS